MYCIETKELTHSFSSTEIVLNKINLQIPTGSIYGFLGPNGAGKTTTLRLILGLLKKQKGVITIFDKPFEGNRIETLSKIGSLIEAPSLYAHLTAKENLLILQKVYNCPKSRIDDVLEIVGLSDTKKKKAGKFSLGMKQRLSIAMALLHNPSLLILDEPTNGLDPNGIIEIRELLKKINKDSNVTIVISSHLLSEIEKLVTHLGIIHKGSVLFQGTLEELHIEQSLTSLMRFQTSDNKKAFELVSKHNIVPTIKDDSIVIPNSNKSIIAQINKDFVVNNIDVYQINTEKNDLESIFIDLVK